MIGIIFLFVFLVYHFIAFRYSEVIFSSTGNKRGFKSIAAVINGSLFAMYYLFLFHESILLIAFLFLLSIEFYIGYTRYHLKSLFGALSFATNFFAIRLAVMALYALYTKQPLSYFVANVEANMECTIVAMITCCLYIITFRYTLTNRYITTIQSSLSNVKFATKILFCIYVFQIFNTINSYVTNDYMMLPLLQLKTAICAIVGFCAALLYAYLLSRLDIFKDVAKVMEKQIVVQQKESQDLEKLAYIDQYLECYSRTYGLLYLEDTIKMETEYFSIIYFDLDGLKSVNDKYGHLEGDIYIKNIVNIIKTVFKTAMICRMGGDEFMVVLRDTDEFDAYKFAIRVCEGVEMKNKETKQSYAMSLSYGVLEINKKNRMSGTKILKIVDEKMYTFKNSRKKARFM